MCVMIAFSHSERLRMLIGGERMVSSEWRMGDAERTIRHSPFAIQRPDCRLPAEQVLEDAQNGKG